MKLLRLLFPRWHSPYQCYWSRRALDAEKQNKRLRRELAESRALNRRLFRHIGDSNLRRDERAAK